MRPSSERPRYLDSADLIGVVVRVKRASLVDHPRLSAYAGTS
jgi:hypothetical protein